MLSYSEYLGRIFAKKFCRYGAIALRLHRNGNAFLANLRHRETAKNIIS